MKPKHKLAKDFGTGWQKPEKMTDVCCPDCGHRFPIIADVKRNGKKCKCAACGKTLTILVQGEGEKTLFSLLSHRRPGPTQRERDEAGI